MMVNSVLLLDVEIEATGTKERVSFAYLALLAIKVNKLMS